MTDIGQLQACLRQMVAVLERERNALAGIDHDEVLISAREKETLCARLADAGSTALDDQTRALVDTARRLNETNRKVRNLLAANVEARLEALGARSAYRSAGGRIRA
jgi:hypothetical protein